MLQIKNNNLFFADTMSQYGVLKVLNYYDADDINWIYLYNKDIFLSKLIKNNSFFYNLSTLKDILSNSNLFRVDMLVIESSDITIINELRKYTNIPIIVLTTDIIASKDLKDYDFVYSFSSKYDKSQQNVSYKTRLSSSNISKMFFVREVKSLPLSRIKKLGDEFEIESLYELAIRDKKLSILLNESHT